MKTTHTYHAEVIGYDLENQTLRAMVREPGKEDVFLEVSVSPPVNTLFNINIEDGKFSGGLVNAAMAESLPVGSVIMIGNCVEQTRSVNGNSLRVVADWISPVAPSRDVIHGAMVISDDSVRMLDGNAIPIGDQAAMSTYLEGFNQAEKPAPPQGVYFRAMVDRGDHYQVVSGTDGFSWIPSSEPGEPGRLMSESDVREFAKGYEQYIKETIAPYFPDRTVAIEMLPFKSYQRSVFVRDGAPGLGDEIDGAMTSDKLVRLAKNTEASPEIGGERVVGLVAVNGAIVIKPMKYPDDQPACPMVTQVAANSIPQSIYGTIASDKPVVVHPNLIPKSTFSMMVNKMRARAQADQPEKPQGPAL